MPGIRNFDLVIEMHGALLTRVNYRGSSHYYVTGKINQFDAEPTPFDSLMDQPVEEKYLEVLKTSDVFNKAICTPDEGLLTWENLYEYPPFVAFFTQFVAAYQEIEEDFK